MGIFFNVKKPREFRHQPIYFDPRKDALEERIRNVKKELGQLPEEEYKPNLKGAFVNQTSHVRRHQEGDGDMSSKNVKLALALVILVGLFCYLYVNSQ